MDFLCPGLSGIDPGEDIWTLCQIVSSPSTQNSMTSERALRVLLENINKESAEEHRDDSASAQDRLVLESVAVTSAISKYLSTADEMAVTSDLFPQIFCALIRLISSAVGNDQTGCEAFSRCGLAVDALKTLLERHNRCEDSMEWVELLKWGETHADGISHLVAYLVASGAGWIKEIVRGLLPLLEMSHQTHLITGPAFFMEFLYYPGIIKKEIQKDIMKAMIKLSTSSSSAVRCLCIRAFSNAANGAHKMIPKYKDSILGTLLASMCNVQGDLSIIEESIKASSRIVNLLSRKEMGLRFAHMTTICHTFLTYGKQSIQMEAVLLLGKLAQKCKNVRKVSVAWLFITSLPLLLLKLQHRDIEMVSAAQFCLYHCLPVVGCKDLQNLLQGQNITQGGRQWLNTFYKALVKQHTELAYYLVEQSAKLLVYTEALCQVIKQIGYLVKFMDAWYLYELNHRIPIKQLYQNMRELAQYPLPLVKEAARDTASLLLYRWHRIDTPAPVLSMRAAVLPTGVRIQKSSTVKPLKKIREERKK